MKKLKKFLKKSIKNNPKIVMPTKEQLELIYRVSKDNPFYWSIFLEIYEFYEDWDNDVSEMVDIYRKQDAESDLRYDFGMSLFIEELYDIASKLFEKYLEDFPNHINTNYNLAQCYEIEQDNRAIEYYKKVLNLDPLHIASYFSLAKFYRNKNQYKMALKLYKKVLTIEGLPINDIYQVFLNMGDIYRDIKKPKKAIACYTKAITINKERDDNPRNYFLYLKVGVLSPKKYKIEYFKKATNSRPDRYEAYYYLGTTYLDNKKYKKAISSLKKALDLNKQFAQAEVNLGVAYERLDKDKKAMACYERALKLDKSVFQAYINLFSLYEEEHNYPPEEIEKEFIERFKEERDVYVQYVVTMYLLDIYHGKKIDLDVFEKEYKNAGKACCTFDAKIILKETRKKDKKQVKELIEVLKKYTKVIK